MVQFLFVQRTRTEPMLIVLYLSCYGPAMCCSLYRHFDATGVLLYVGVSKNVDKRSWEHRKERAWFAEVASTTVEPFPTRQKAEAAERVAIRNENPKHNVSHTPPVFYRR